MPALSIIVPNYNHARYLERRFDSIFQQSFQDYEVIILDDCSTDTSREEIEKIRDHVKVADIVFNDKNSGNTFVQWEKGIALATGDYIWIAESDDFCEPVFVETLLEPMIKDETVVLSFCQTTYVNEHLEILGCTHGRHLQELIPGKVFVAEKMLGLNGIPNASLVIFRKSHLLPLFDKIRSFRYCGDWYFFMMIALTGNVFISGKHLSYFLRHSRNVSGNAEKSGLFFLEGNQFFEEISNKTNATQDQIEAALKLKIRRYLDTSQEMSIKTRKSVLLSIKKMHPSALSIYKRYILKDQLKGLIPSFLKY